MTAVSISVKNLSFFYGDTQALHHIHQDFLENRVSALIGPSGCGKTTLLRCCNRMNELYDGTKVTGAIYFKDKNIYDHNVDPVEVRKKIGMVFQKPNPFPKSIYDNIAWGAKINGYMGNMDELAEQSLRRTGLWEEVKDKLKSSAMNLSGGQQQRLCIARAIAIQPDVILMDEPTSALDPASTGRIESLIEELKTGYTIIIVTHNMQQAGRISDQTIFLLNGEIVESGNTAEMFLNPQHERTEAYISGRFG